MDFAKSLRSGPCNEKPHKKQKSLKDKFLAVSTKLGGNSAREQKKQQNLDLRKDQRRNQINANRIQNTSSVSSEDASLASNYILSPGKQRLAEWKDKRRQAAVSRPLEKRPIFKVTHVDENLLGRPLKQMAKSYSFAATTNNRTKTVHTGTHNSTLMEKTEKKPVHIFGKDTDAKFTFDSRSIETFPEFVERQEATPIKESPMFLSNYSDMIKDLTPKDREFLSETMNIRNKIKGLSSSSSLSHINEPNANTSQNANGYSVCQGGKLNRQSIEKLTIKLDGTLTITPEIRIKYPTCSTVNPVRDLNNLDTPAAKGLNCISPINSTINMASSDSQTIEVTVIECPNKDTRASIIYYRALVEEQTKVLHDLANYWLEVCQAVSKPPISEENLGHIRCACGLAKLLIDERFSQCCDLIDTCENTNAKKDDKELGGKLVLASDLQGFWDMIYPQVVDVKKRFVSLSKLRENNWVGEIEVEVVAAVVKKFKAKKINPLSKKCVGAGAATAEKVKSKPVASKFAAFRANMQKSKANEDKSSEIAVDIIVTKPAVVGDEVAVDMKDRRKSSRKSIRPEISLENVIDCPVEKQGQKYHLRTARRSDLMDFDSPSKTPRRTMNRGAFCENSIIAEATETETTPEQFHEVVFDFDDEYKPSINIGNKKNELNKENSATKVPMSFTGGAGLQMNALSSPKTPHHVRQRELRCNSNEKVAGKSPQQFKNISNSPLLKLLRVSSHGKRQSLSTGKNAALTNLADNDN